MKERWVPHFLGTLAQQQRLGRMGSSRKVTLYADGDGDYRPKFSWALDLPEVAHPTETYDGDTFFDAG